MFLERVSVEPHERVQVFDEIVLFLEMNFGDFVVRDLGKRLLD